MSEEKRKHTRLKLHVPVVLRPEGSRNPIRGETTDLSLSGFYVEMMFTLDIGTYVSITLQLGDTAVLGVGRVVTRDPQVGNGIQLTRVQPEDREELGRFLRAAEQRHDAIVDTDRYVPTDEFS